ncbi:unnamed protein product [Angiostrongylus costaricensis]|uniref:LAGLIDADG_2 domain-containing protein n=1 Tax=Angiostrongylus costaricensis TaxID=334426 RepID=A0A0R3PZL1_ANGCS|nr:unnamed protein product [Angiostrongylus costaricensis]
MEESTSGWFTIRDGTMLVWEGVCALELKSAIYLFKIRNKNLLSDILQVSSDGYWYCVEISGSLGNAKAPFYYHSDCTRNARRMLKHLTACTSLNITSLTIRLDPDPLRHSSLENIVQRVTTWSQLGKESCSDYRIVLDSEMPL